MSDARMNRKNLPKHQKKGVKNSSSIFRASFINILAKFELETFILIIESA